MPEIVSVGMGEGHVRKGSDAVLLGLGLGSCVAVCLYDPVVKVGGMAHVMLPATTRDANAPFRFGDTAVAALLQAVEKAGALRIRIQMAISGGAKMFTSMSSHGALDIGSRNVEATRQAAKAAGLTICAEDVGGTSGRSVYLHVDTGRLVVRTIGKPERELAILGSVKPHAAAAASRPASMGAAR